MTGSSAELRTAAATLRALATAASTATATPIERGGKPSTRWHFAERTSSTGYLYAENPNGPGARLTHGGTGRDSHPGMRTRHGQYAAAMDPTTGLALAHALDETADSVEQDGGIVQDSTTDALLDVARTINGSQP
ncbi:hypothetical protein [Streptomyces lasiicapitis]|uniref:hypothetical protein n=1 Tax=Streptomyces lasiicapitis TaxID=1923961 RepID=UPI003655F7A2